MFKLFLGIHLIDSLPFLHELIGDLKPRVELIEGRRILLILTIDIRVPLIHIVQARLELLMGPNKLNLLRLFVFALDDELRLC
jgi:hypothetical protein